MAATVVIAAGTWVGAAQGAEGERHVIKVTAMHLSPSADNPWEEYPDYDWTATANLYAGDGTHIYHWTETHKGHGGAVRWEYTDGGDGGWIWLEIKPKNGGKTFAYDKIPLGENHCYDLDSRDGWYDYYVSKALDCPFDGEMGSKYPRQ